MHRRTMGALAIGIIMTFVAASAQAQEPTAKEGWVQLPESGETSAKAFALVKNPGMYDVYLVSASSDVAGKVEFRRAGDSETKAVGELTVPAYGKLSMGPDGVHVVLVDLKHSLKADESVSITLTTDSNVKIRIKATVRKE